MTTRVSVDIDDDVLAAAQCTAEEEKLSLGLVLSEMARRGMEPLKLVRAEDGMLVFDTPEGLPTITDEDVRRLLADFP